MKKTIIAMMALAGVASALPETGIPQVNLEVTSNGISWVNAFTDETVKDLGKNNVTINADGSFTTNGANQFGDRLGGGANYTPKVDGVEMKTFTLQFDADWTRNTSGSTMLVGWGEGGEWGFGFGIDESGNWTVVQGKYNKPVEVHTSGIAAVDNGTQTYTIIGEIEQIGALVWDGYINQVQGTYHVNVYEGDTLVYSASYGNETNKIGFGQTYDPYIGFGAGVNGAGAATVTYSNVKLIPEPTTATLSLLALAGLAARRRRK